MIDKHDKRKFEEFTRELVSGPYSPDVRTAVVDLCRVIVEVPKASSPAAFDLVQARLSNAAWLVQRSMRKHLSHREHGEILRRRPAFFGELVTGPHARQLDICKAVSDLAANVSQKHRPISSVPMPLVKAKPRGITS